ncbi:MAG: NUDIX hydrolase [Bacteriovoracia bacterium]
MKKWIAKEKSLKFKGKIFEYYEQKFFSPYSNQEGSFDILNFANWVNVIAITKNDEIVMVKQFRVGSNDFTCELPGGAIDMGEEPLKAARRELVEETGFKATRWEKLFTVTPNPAFQRNKCITYIAYDATACGEIFPDFMEEIQVEKWSWEKIHVGIEKGYINHALIVAALYRAARHLGR